MGEREQRIDAHRRVIDEFRAGGGHVGGRLGHLSLLVLTATGARSGRPRTVALTYMADGDAYVVIAANGGRAGHPDWYFNLRAHPDAVVEVGDRTVSVTASEVAGARREELLAAFTAENPQTLGYRSTTSRPFPVIRLAPR